MVHVNPNFAQSNRRNHPYAFPSSQMPMVRHWDNRVQHPRNVPPRPQPTVSPGFHAFSCAPYIVVGSSPSSSSMNKRVFVDGKAHEVFFVGEEALIERNGLPHRIVFSGPPRDVIIDNVPYRLAFGESRAVFIDGETHVLRFGTPSRELYMGNYPFKGTFGGPPIIASINGQRHEIRLCGPVPEIRVMPEPCYEMMRFLPEIRVGQQRLKAEPARVVSQAAVQMQVPQKKDDPLDVQGFLKKLQKSGVLEKVSQAVGVTSKQEIPSKARCRPFSSSVEKDSEPIPSNHGFFLQNLRRMAAPMSSLDQFSIRSLVIRYDSVINSLHKPRIECPGCGITFKDLYGRAYQLHQDWHMKDAIESKERKYTRTRPWFMTDEWFSYSETDFINLAGNIDNKPCGEAAEKGNTDLFSGDLEIKKCCVCHETFDEYWDDEDDAWKIKDCIVEREKPFHRTCWFSIDPCSFFESLLAGNCSFKESE